MTWTEFIECNICVLGFESDQSLKDHLDSCHNAGKEENITLVRTTTMKQEREIPESKKVKEKISTLLPDIKELIEITNIDIDKIIYEQDLKINIPLQNGKMKTNKEMFNCIVCQEEFVIFTDLEEHILKSHTGKKSHIGQDFSTQKRNTVHQEPVDDEPYQIDANKESPSLPKNTMSEEGKQNSDLKCNVFTTSFGMAANLTNHRLTHKDRKPHNSYVSPYSSFYNPSSLQEQMLFDGKTTHKCDVCRKWYRSSRGLEKHMIVHTVKTPYKCYVCQRGFISTAKLRKHTLVHTGEKSADEKRHKCDVCQRRFSNASTLRCHMLIHTGEKPHACKVCQKAFRSISDVRKHMIVHTVERPHKCDVCQKGFAGTALLKRHITTHTDEKPHKCEICQKYFKHTETLRKHKLTHTGYRPHKCDVCQKKFTKKSNVKRHMSVHTNEKPYECDICHVRFTKSRYVKRHKSLYCSGKT